jgi:predicted nuclease of predicted toxin-antitoxin system
MKFLIDAQLPPALCGWLRERGHEAVHVSEIGMIAASDVEIAARAEADGAVLVSKDEDFVTLRLPDRFAFLWLRCGNASNRALVAWLEPRWVQVEALLSSGERFVEVR